MSSLSQKKRILTLGHQGHELLETLLKIQPLLRGSLAQVHTRCGKPNCWCAQSAQGHPHLRLTWSQSGQMTTRKVPAQLANTLREMTDNYRHFRSLRRKLLALNTQLQDLLDGHEQDMIMRAQRPLISSGFNSKMSPRSDRRRQKPLHEPKPND